MNIKDKILQALSQRNNLTTDEIAQEVGERHKDVKATLQDLQTDGKIVQGEEPDTWSLK